MDSNSLLKVVKYKSREDAQKILEDYLSIDPAFVEYKRIIDEHEQNLDLITDDNQYPDLAYAKRYPGKITYDKKQSLERLLSTNLPISKRIEIVRALRDSSNGSDRVSYAKSAYGLSNNINDLFSLGVIYYTYGIYDDAYKTFQSCGSMGNVYVAKCLANGYGVEKDINLALKILDEECKKCNDDALTAIKDIIKKNGLYLNEYYKWTFISSFQLSQEEKNAIVIALKTDGFVTISDLGKLLTHDRENRIGVADSFIKRFGSEVIDDTKYMHYNSLELAAIYASRVDQSNFYEALNSMCSYPFPKEVFEFYYNGAYYAAGDLNITHTKNELALFLDYPISKAEMIHNSINKFIRDKNVKKDLVLFLCFHDDYKKKGMLGDKALIWANIRVKERYNR